MSKLEQRRFQEQMMRIQMNNRKIKEQKQMFNSAMIIICWVLHDKFGFGSKRLERLIDEVNEFNDNFNAGLIEPNELIEQLKEETGIEFKEG